MGSFLLEERCRILSNHRIEWLGRLILSLQVRKQGSYALSLNGAIKMCFVEKMDPKIWLHVIMPPANEELFSNSSGLNVPSVLIEFLSFANGIDLFRGEMGISQLAIHGLVSFPRDMRDDVWLPHNLEEYNLTSRLSGLPQNDFVFGSYQWDGSVVVMTPAGEIYRRLKEKNQRLNTWPNLQDFLVKEVERLDGFFDSNNLLVDPNKATTPRGFKK